MPDRDREHSAAAAARRRRRPPAPLVLLVAVALIMGTAWTFAVAPLQQPDEPNHMARVQRMAEGGSLAKRVTRDWSTDQTVGAGAVNALGLPGLPTIKPPWDDRADAAYRREAAKLGERSRGDADAPTGADNNPPAFYLWAVPWYHLGGDFLTRVWVLRLVDVLWLGVSVVGAWLLVGEVFGRRRLLQAAGTSLVALQPIAGSLSSAVSPDGMLVALCTLALWLTARTMRRGLAASTLLGLAGSLILAVATKSVAFALVPPAVLAVTIVALRSDLGRRLAPRTVRGRAASAAAILVALVSLFALLRVLAPTVAPLLASPLSNIPPPRRFLSYLWQFYLGPADFLVPTPNLGSSARFDLTWIRQAWGSFGPLDSGLSTGLLTAIRWIGWVIAAAAGVALIVRRRRVDLGLLTVFALGALLMLLGLHVTEYGILSNFIGGPILQGRYLLPLIGLGALVVAAAVALVPRGWQAPVVGLLLAGLITVELSGLAAAFSRYYAY